MSRGLKRFFIICAAVTCLGLIAATIGYAAGGVSGMEKISDRYSWIRAGAPEMTDITLAETMDSENVSFDSVSIKGDGDISFISGNAGDTRLIYDEKAEAPEFTIKDGVLTVDVRDANDGVLINLGAADSTPQLIVCIPQGATLENIDISSDYGDIELHDLTANTLSIRSNYGDIDITDITYNTADIESDCGNITLDGVDSEKLSIASDQGDVKISGRLSGSTDITADYGNTDILTSLPESSYSIDVKADLGRIKIGSHDYGDTEHISFGSGINMINIAADMGDVSIGFADSSLE